LPHPGATVYLDQLNLTPVLTGPRVSAPVTRGWRAVVEPEDTERCCWCNRRGEYGQYGVSA
jgi:hypothetical protein